jgi:DNA-binding CsgD family transcriptional regulator
MLSSVFNNIGVTYREAGDSLKAKTYILQALQLYPAIEKPVNMLLNLAYLYYDLHQTDSAAFYANRIVQLCKNDSTRNTPASVYDLLANIETRKADYKKALAYHVKYTNRIFDLHQKEKEQSIAGIQEKYNLETVKNQNQKLVIRQLWTGVIAALAVLLLTGGLLVVSRRSGKHKINLLKAKNERDKLYEQRISILKKTSMLRQSLKNVVGIPEDKIDLLLKTISPILYDTNDGFTWEGLYSLIDDHHNGLFSRLQQYFPQLKPTELKVCSLVYMEFKNKEIAKCLNLKLDTIQTTKYSIRKKFGLHSRGDIKQFLVQNFAKTTV